MANFTVFGNDSVAKTLLTNEEGVIAGNGNLVTAGNSIVGNGTTRLNVLGNVSAQAGDGFTSGGSGDDYVTVGQNGSILGYATAIDINKTIGDFDLHNYGAISNPSGDAVNVNFDGGGDSRVLNTGTITSQFEAIQAFLGDGVSRINNTGTIISARGFTIFVDTSGADFLTNSGVIMHGVPFSRVVSAGSGPTTILNTGEISGDVLLNNGDDIYNGINGLQTEVLGGGGNDTIYTSASKEKLFGGSGDDTIFGNGGGDEIYGGSGNDVMRGGAEADEFDGGDNTDWVYYQNSDRGVEVDLTSGFGFGGHAEGDTYENVERVWGTQFQDELNGNSDDNYLVGGNGNDIMRGYNGNDQFRGDGGADVMNGGSGFDTLIYSASNGAVNVNLTLGTASGGHATGDIYFSMERVTGSQYGDTLTGSSIGNQINGLDGDDRIRGYLGNDLMNGGNGADTFIFDNNGGNDIIVGFENDVDKLDLSVYGYASAAQVLALATVVGADVFITRDANDSIRLVGFAPNIGDLSDDLIL